jgi:hypothetical protein
MRELCRKLLSPTSSIVLPTLGKCCVLANSGVLRRLHALGGDSTATAQIKYLDQRLGFVQILGYGRDKVKFALDPLSEYLAGLSLVDKNRDLDRGVGFWMRWARCLS